MSKLMSDVETRTSYIRAKLGILVPSQIKALRLKSEMPRQADLAKAAHVQQSRISMFETPGAANITLETLSRIAAAFKVGVMVRFVPFSEMLGWENSFSQDRFDVMRLDNDVAFLNPPTEEYAAVSRLTVRFSEVERQESRLDRERLGGIAAAMSSQTTFINAANSAAGEATQTQDVPISLLTNQMSGGPYESFGRLVG